MHLLTSKNRTSKSRKIDFSEKKFEKNLNVPKFLWSRSGRNFCRQGRIPQGHKCSSFQSWNIPRKTRKVVLTWRYEAFGQKPHFWTTWWLFTLKVQSGEKDKNVSKRTEKSKFQQTFQVHMRNVLRHSCPFPQISLLRNSKHRKVKIFHLSQKLEFFNFEKKISSAKKYVQHSYKTF